MKRLNLFLLTGQAKAAYVRITLTGGERPENGAGIYSFEVYRE